MLGVEYLTESILTAMKKSFETMSYRVYHTDCLRLISCALGNNPGKRYWNIIRPEPADERTGMEIAEERLERFGVKVVD